MFASCCGYRKDDMSKAIASPTINVFTVSEADLKAANTDEARIKLTTRCEKHAKVIFQQPSYELEGQNASRQNRLKAFVELTTKYEQWHLFDAEWAKLSQNAKDAFLDQAIQAKALDHIPRFRELITTKVELSSVEPVAESERLDLGFCEEEFMELDKLGKRVLAERRVGFILVAGGLGERLGATQIKISLPVETLTGRSFLETFLAHLRSFSVPQPPLFIMTSGDTHEKTKELLTSLNIPFGVSGSSNGEPVILAEQETVASFLDKNGNLALKAPGTLMRKPHGHGDVHPLFRKSCLEDWMSKHLEYAVFFQDTNPSCFRVIPSLIGAAERAKVDCAVACVPRVPKSATGCIAKNPTTKTIENFEYNLMNAYFAQKPELDEKFYLGNTNQLLVRLSAYAGVPSDMPEFSNPKFATGSTTVFSSPARLECLMQDVMRFFPKERVLPVLYRDAPENSTKTHVLYAPAKSSLQVAKRAWDAGTSDGSAASSEAAVYALNCALLRHMGCSVETDNETKVEFGEGMFIKPLEPCVVFDPLVLPFFSDATIMFPEPKNVFIGKTSSVEFRGPGSIVCKNLYVDGSVVIWSKVAGQTLFVDDLIVKNSGRAVESVQGDARLKIRHGEDYKLVDS